MSPLIKLLLGSLPLLASSFIIYFLSINVSSADLQKDIVNKLLETETLVFDFKQKISDKEETGNCFIKYPLLMKCNYKNSKVLYPNDKLT